MMATLGFLVLVSACLAVNAFPEEAVPYRNTIFGDEKLEGGIFEDVDSFNDITLSNNADNPFRLPTTTRPQHYNILWTVNIANLSFTGEEFIDLYATRANVNEIVIHAHDLHIDYLNLELNGTTVFQTYTLEPEHHFLRVRLTSGYLEYSSSSPVIYRLSISFNAPLRTDMYGIYQSWYRNNPTDEVSWMASTQFQATAARFAFPCYDEPSFKAVFDISISRPSSFKSWSCTRQERSYNSTDSDYVVDVYYPTPVMSTYLLAIIVAEYETKDLWGPDTDGVEVLKYEVIARTSAIESGQGNYSFDIGQDLLAEMSDHTGMDFYSVHPTIKMTQAAIPDFSAGAMENWGLLTYREAYLLYTEEDTNSYFKQLIAYILSHEIAHMWFGNLVTCDWWDVLWINEGFARYYQYFLTDWVDGDMGLGDRFITEQIHTSLLSDSSDNPQPLSFNPGVGSPSSVSNMFSTISYNKGAAVIRMTEHLMGFYNHREGLRKYLSDRRFTSVLPDELFQDLQEVALLTGAISEYGPDFSIVDYYKTWTEQGGHPVLNVYVNHQTGLMTINQRRFNINSGYSTPNTNWIVPVTFATASDPDFINTKPTHTISDAISTINRTSIGDEWVIFNKQQTGFYRVNYDDYTWDLNVMLLRGPNRTTVHEYNRAQIVNDVFQFARSGVMTYTRAFNILSFMSSETEYTPWLAAITGFNWINNRLINTELEVSVNTMFLNWSTTVINDLTYDEPEEEPFMRSYLRYQLAPVLCRLGAPACLEAARNKFSNLRTNGEEVPVDSRNWVYCNGLRQGTVDDFEFLWQRFIEHPVYTEKIQLLMVLGCTPHEQSLNKFLDAIVEENHIIRRQDYTTAFNSAVTGNEMNTQIVFSYIKANPTNVIEAFRSVTTPLSYISSRLRTVEEVNEFREWAHENQDILGTSYQDVSQAAQTSLDALEWSEQVQSDINDYLISGDNILEYSTEAPIVTTTPVTATAAPIVAPTTPDLPDSANTSFLSALVIMVAIVSNFVF